MKHKTFDVAMWSTGHKTFDVAMWSTGDIVSTIEARDIKIHEDRLHEFVYDVIDRIGDIFDASVGVNWDVIEGAIEDVKSDYDAEDIDLSSKP